MALILLAVDLTSMAVWAQEAPESRKTTESKVATFDETELDRWKGCSLGIRIDRENGDVFVNQVHRHVAEQCPLEPGDRLVSIDELEISETTLPELDQMLNSTGPETEMQVVVEREGQQKTLSLTTCRRQLVDVAAIVERLKSNQVIKKYLEETDRTEYLNSVAERLINAVRESQTPREAAEAINAIIDEIDVSHTAILPAQSMGQISGKSSGDLGLTLQRHRIGGKNRYFVVDRMPGTAGYDSELVLGDELVSFNGVPLEKSRRLILSGQEHRRRLFFIAVKSGDRVEIEFRRRQNGPLQSVTLTARDSIPAEDVVVRSARIIESGENRYGYIRFWNFMSMDTMKLAKEVIDGKFEDCDMLIFDLRGRGGLIPVVLGMKKLVSELDVPVIAITDNLTRSAKEMFSYLVKELPHVTVIGQTTAGAVTGATIARLPSGYGLMYPAVSSEALKRFTDGVVLEGKGVEPDIRVDFQIPYCGGNDRLLEAAIETADRQIREFLDSIL